ncbi:MAG: hypothetical protein V4510_10335 [bacterium]
MTCRPIAGFTAVFLVLLLAAPLPASAEAQAQPAGAVEQAALARIEQQIRDLAAANPKLPGPTFAWNAMAADRPDLAVRDAARELAFYRWRAWLDFDENHHSSLTGRQALDRARSESAAMQAEALATMHALDDSPVAGSGPELEDGVARALPAAGIVTQSPYVDNFLLSWQRRYADNATDLSPLITVMAAFEASRILMQELPPPARGASVVAALDEGTARRVHENVTYWIGSSDLPSVVAGAGESYYQDALEAQRPLAALVYMLAAEMAHEQSEIGAEIGAKGYDMPATLRSMHDEGMGWKPSMLTREAVDLAGFVLEDGRIAENESGLAIEAVARLAMVRLLHGESPPVEYSRAPSQDSPGVGELGASLMVLIAALLVSRRRRS